MPEKTVFPKKAKAKKWERLILKKKCISLASYQKKESKKQSHWTHFFT